MGRRKKTEGVTGVHIVRTMYYLRSATPSFRLGQLFVIFNFLLYLSTMTSAEEHSMAYGIGLERLQTSATSWNDDFCYVCLSYAYTISSPSIWTLDGISREVGLNRYLHHQSIRDDLVC